MNKARLAEAGRGIIQTSSVPPREELTVDLNVSIERSTRNGVHL